MKLKRWWLSLIVVIGWVLLLPITGRADGSYDISKYDVNVNVLANGDADLTQRITYRFDGHFNGVYYNQDLHGIKGAETPQVTVQDANQSATPLTAQADGRNNSFQVTNTADALTLKVFHKISDQSATYTYSYRLRGVVTNYADTARINWKVIGAGWDVSLNNVKVTIQLPQQQVDKLQAWTHGPLDGQTQVDKKRGRVVMTLAHNPANQFVESDMLFPTAVTAANTNVVNQKMKASVQKQERQLVTAANQKRQRARQVNFGMLATLGALILALLGGTWLYIWRRPANRHTPIIPVNHWYEVPTVSPALAQSLLTNKAPTTKGFTGELLTAVNDGQITIEPQDKTYLITKQKDISEPLTQFLIDEVGDGESMSMQVLKKFGKRDTSGRLNSQFQQWQGRIEDQRDQFYDGHNSQLRTWWLIVAVVITALVGLGAVIAMNLQNSIRNGIWISGTVLIALTWAWTMWQRHRINRYTAEGDQQVNELQGFRRMLNDIGHFDTAQVGDMVIWEQILPYAAAFGLAEKVTKALAAQFGTEAMMKMGVIFPLYYGLGGFTGSFDSGFSGGLSSSISASNTQSSSSIGGSGGFSGGSTGGFGGGSGGGAF